jgi:predicted PurR-regulated permease PerM
MKDYSFIIIGIVLLIVLSILSWKFERWFNWKLGYGSKVESTIEKKIEQLELRIEKIERRFHETDNMGESAL